MSSNKDMREHAPQHFNILARSLHWLMAVMIPPCFSSVPQ